ncbi:hypothetical protein CDL15_Pgr006703 [Punica granatum]|nr:hypothetical protein CDL15_Pgr006703 [Punica granatum]
MEEELSRWPRISAAKASVIGHCTESVNHAGLSLEKVSEARRQMIGANSTVESNEDFRSNLGVWPNYGQNEESIDCTGF